jgi:2-polyprenyl-3-methyl-5-hydroxy-6-metoxy-1,4-benzoquinol methylase
VQFEFLANIEFGDQVMETVNCNLCGSALSEEVFQAPDAHHPSDEMFTVVRCMNCGLNFLNPRPTVEEMQQHYPSDYFCSESLASARKRYRIQANLVESLSTESKLLLDVGCANGDFPRFMKGLGWTVEGVEVALQSADIDDFHVYRCPFTEAPIPKERFDVVTMWAVLEHVHDPMGYFRMANSVLKKNGYIIFATNHVHSLFPSSQYREDIPRHLYCFTEASLRKYMEVNGFEVVLCRYGRELFERDPHNWLFYLKHVLLLRKRRFRISDMKKGRKQFLEENGLAPGLSSSMKYIFRHPLATIDTFFAPILAYVEILLGKYGFATYVGKKR